MPSLGFAILFLACVQGTDTCQTVNVYASRFADRGACEASLPATVRLARRRWPDTAALTARCESLDQLCHLRAEAPAVILPAVAKPVEAPLMRVDVSWPGRVAGLAPARAQSVPGAIAEVLDILCKPPKKDEGCLG